MAVTDSSQQIPNGSVIKADSIISSVTFPIMLHLVSRHDVVDSAVLHDSQTPEKSVCFLI
jgi:hypothetical protein